MTPSGRSRRDWMQTAVSVWLMERIDLLPPSLATTERKVKLARNKPETSVSREPGSRYMKGRPGELARPESFPLANLLIAPDKYSYEGDWLFCSFRDAEVLAARIGFGRGKLDWKDYGVEDLPVADEALFWRVEVVTKEGIYAFVSSDPSKGKHLVSEKERLQVRFQDSGQVLFQIEGWPRTSWHFRNPEATLQVRLDVRPERLAVWPDFLMPNNTFSMCLGTCQMTGDVQIEGKTYPVRGAGVFDHPRIVVEPNPVAPFGWYLYAPILFADGTQVVSYYSENGRGEKNSNYSAGFLVNRQGECFWLQEHRVRRLRVSDSELPVSWEAELAGEGVSVSYRVQIADTPMIRGWGNANQPGKDKYAGYPLLMQVAGECRVQGRGRDLQSGAGICEFLVRKDLRPRFP